MIAIDVGEMAGLEGPEGREGRVKHKNSNAEDAQRDLRALNVFIINPLAYSTSSVFNRLILYNHLLDLPGLQCPPVFPSNLPSNF